MANKLPIELRAKEALLKYNGTNDYILQLKNHLVKKGTLPLTTGQSKYILENKTSAPVVVNKVFKLHKSCRDYLQKAYNLDFTPEVIYIHKLLARKADDLHVWGCFQDNCKYYFSIHISKFNIRKEKNIPMPSFDEYERKPKPHQPEAILALLNNDKFILADDMGLGKTTSSILAAIKGGYKRILIVCPASLKHNWRREISMYENPNDISVIDGSDFVFKKWTILNYDILKNFHFLKEKDQEFVKESIIDYYKFDLVIADEAHYLKDSSSNRSKIFIDFAEKIPVRWFLTGTPITNKPIDFYNLLHLCESPLAANWMHFVRRYCAGKQFYKKGSTKDKKEKFWVISGASNLDELREFTSDIILRRTKRGSLELPQKTKKTIYLPLSMSERYNKYITEYKEWVKKQREAGIPPKPTEHLTQLIKVRQLISEDKVKNTIEIAEDYIAMGKKVIIFSCFTNTITSICEHFGKSAVLVDGSVSAKNRDIAVDKFQNDDKTTVFCANIIAGGVGLTLTSGTVVIFNDLDWVPANHAQAEDRPYRIGQTEEVHIIYPLVDETIDVTMYDSLMKKMEVIGTIMNDSVIDSSKLTITEEVINSLSDS